MAARDKGESRSYLVGLPVLITVWDDGTVVYDVGTEEASVAIWDDLDQPDTDTLKADAQRIEDDHERSMK